MVRSERIVLRGGVGGRGGIGVDGRVGRWRQDKGMRRGGLTT